MFKGKSKLFWCGLFVLLYGAYSIFRNVASSISLYSTYLTESESYELHPPPANMQIYTANFLNSLINGIINNTIWLVPVIILTIIGVYMMRVSANKEKPTDITPS